MKKTFPFILPAYKQVAAFSLLACFLSSSYAETASEQKAVWFRYYDSRGVENISDKVTPEHIRYGYEALDRNRQVIRRNTPYNSEKDQLNSAKRAQQVKQRALDETLKKAYSNSHVAIQKQKDSLAHIQKQIAFQNEQLKILERDRALFQKQAAEYSKDKKPLPANLKQLLQNNQLNINDQKRYIQSLQSSYRATQANYDRLIQRLKALE